MPKIESIRPGETIEASFERYPLADLLAGILRGNLSGRMTVFLHPEPRNIVVFRDGVPCWVDLPDTRVSLVSLMVRRGLVQQERGLDILRVAEASGRSESALIEQTGVLPAGELMRVKVDRARAQLVRLFDLGAVDFAFTEGTVPQAYPFPTILQPLPLIFEGLCSVEGALDGFAAGEARAMYSLTGTYPRGVDAFEWGAPLEALIEQPAWSIAALREGGLSPQVAAAALYVLKKFDMVEPAGGAARRSVRPQAAGDPSPSTPQSGPQAPAGLVVHRREATERAPSGMSVEAELVELRERLAPYRDQSYYQILRVSPSTDPAQLDRSYRFQVRRLKEEGGLAAGALADLVEEAYRAVTDPLRAETYAQLVVRGEGNPVMEKERRALEAEVKVERAMTRLSEDRLAEARFLLDWAMELDPSRRELGALAQLAEWAGGEGEAQAARARELKPRLQAELARSGNEPRLFLALAWVLCALGDIEGGRRHLLSAPQRHPLTRKVQRELDQLLVS